MITRKDIPKPEKPFYVPRRIRREDELTIALRRGGDAVLEILKQNGIDATPESLEHVVRSIAETRYTLMLFLLRASTQNTTPDRIAFDIGIRTIFIALISSRLMDELVEQLRIGPRSIHNRDAILRTLEIILLHATIGNQGKRFDMLLRYYADPQSIPECTASIASCMLADLVGRIRDMLCPLTQATPVAQ